MSPKRGNGHFNGYTLSNYVYGWLQTCFYLYWARSEIAAAHLVTLGMWVLKTIYSCLSHKPLFTSIIGSFIHANNPFLFWSCTLKWNFEGALCCMCIFTLNRSPLAQDAGEPFDYTPHEQPFKFYLIYLSIMGCDIQYDVIGLREHFCAARWKGQLTSQLFTTSRLSLLYQRNIELWSWADGNFYSNCGLSRLRHRY